MEKSDRDSSTLITRIDRILQLLEKTAVTPPITIEEQPQNIRNLH